MTFFLVVTLGAGSTAGIVAEEAAGGGAVTTVAGVLAVVATGADGVGTAALVAGTVVCPGPRNCNATSTKTAKAITALST